MTFKTVRIELADKTISAELNQSETAERIYDALPLTGHVNVWGDEIYFEIPVSLAEAHDARADVSVGDLGYWPTGKAFCIFYGPTPVSTDDQPRAYSPVNVFGRIVGDVSIFKGISNGAAIRIDR